MSLALPLALQELLRDHADLQAWARAHTQPFPRLVVGYREPRKAQDWPFVALVAARDSVRLGTDPGLESAAVVLACGVRHSDRESDGSKGLAMVDALADAVIGIAAENPALKIPELLVATHARQTDVLPQHPNYQVEHLLTYERP